jgi:hypothetical protein
MNSLPATPPVPPVNAFADATGVDDEVPLGWECANPALQIERWGIEATAASEVLR